MVQLEGTSLIMRDTIVLLPFDGILMRNRVYIV